MDFHTLSRRELQVLCKQNNIRANMANAAMAEALERLDFVNLLPAPTVTTRLAARSSMSRKMDLVVSNPVPATLRRSQRMATQKALDQEPKGEDGISQVKERAASKMLQAKVTDETCEDDDLYEDEEWALYDDESAEGIGSTDESDEVEGETHEENDTVFTSGILQEFVDEMDNGPDQAVVNELLEDLQGISLNMLRATYKELKDKQIDCSSVASSCAA